MLKHQWTISESQVLKCKSNFGHKNITLKSINFWKYSPESVTSIYPLKWNFPVFDPSEALNYPNEFFNSLDSSGQSTHKIDRKVCSPIMLLRFPDPPRLCNGTRIVVRKIMPHLIEATIVSVFGNDFFIPRIYLIPIDVKILFKRLQLPMKLSYR